MFVCTVGSDHVTLEVVRNGSSHSVLVPIGYDVDDGRELSYFAAVGFDVTAGVGSEMFFTIIEVDHEIGGRHDYWSGQDTNAFILGSDRDRVLDAICCAAQLLIEYGAPDELEVITYDAHPPDKAVIKHFKVMSVFERNGYEIQTFDPYHGRRLWRLVRAAG